MDMINEKLLNNNIVSLGFSFVKKISPGERFSYQTIQKEENFKPAVSILKHIAISPKINVESLLRMKIDNVFYKRDYIIIPNSSL